MPLRTKPCAKPFEPVRLDETKPADVETVNLNLDLIEKGFDDLNRCVAAKIDSVIGKPVAPPAPTGGGTDPVVTPVSMLQAQFQYSVGLNLTDSLSGGMFGAYPLYLMAASDDDAYTTGGTPIRSTFPAVVATQMHFSGITLSYDTLTPGTLLKIRIRKNYENGTGGTVLLSPTVIATSNCGVIKWDTGLISVDIGSTDTIQVDCFEETVGGSSSGGFLKMSCILSLYGDANVPVLQGQKGDKGDTGSTGAAGANGTNGTNGADGTPGVTLGSGPVLTQLFVCRKRSPSTLDSPYNPAASPFWILPATADSTQTETDYTTEYQIGATLALDATSMIITSNVQIGGYQDIYIGIFKNPSELTVWSDAIGTLFLSAASQQGRHKTSVIAVSLSALDCIGVGISWVPDPEGYAPLSFEGEILVTLLGGSGGGGGGGFTYPQILAMISLRA